jgi:hypothetical protein
MIMLAPTPAEAQPFIAERRSSRRFPLRIACVYEISDGDRLQSSGKATTTNMSATGLLLQKADGAQPGLRIRLLLSWPDCGRSIKLAVTGQIVRAGETGVGIRMLRHAFRA